MKNLCLFVIASIYSVSLFAQPPGQDGPPRVKDGKLYGRITDEKTKKGIDFKYYKQTTIRRRIMRRKAITKSSSLKDYQQLLLESKAEQDALFQDILIPVTAFFRDPKVFSLICEFIMPALIRDKPENTPIRIWVPGCSTGEEAYSLAMCISEYFFDSGKPRPVQIFATDIAESVITKARSGIYDKRDVAGISDEKLKLFFTKIDG